jgi:hypothetical protein
LQIEECHGAKLELAANNAFGSQVQAFSIKRYGPVEIVDTERDD